MCLVAIEAVGDVRFLDTDTETSGGLLDEIFEEEVDAAESDVDVEFDIGNETAMDWDGGVCRRW
jgi:hypothetical protein